MGITLSSFATDKASKQMLDLTLRSLHREFVNKDIQNFEDFQNAILVIFNDINSSMPGRHYDAPLREEVEDCYNKWKIADESKRRDVFIDFIKKKIKPRKVDDTTMITGLLTPPAAMAAKRAGEGVPQLRMIKFIPDVVFVPSATVIALVSVKLSQRMLLGRTVANTTNK